MTVAPIPQAPPPVRSQPSSRTRLPISVSLSLLVAVVVVPALVFGVLLLDRYAAAERAGNTAAVENLASRGADALDRELAGMVATLNALANSPALRAGDLPAFERQAEPAATDGGRILVITGPDGADLWRSSGGDLRKVSWTPGSARRTASDLIIGDPVSFVRVSIPLRIPPVGTPPVGIPGPARPIALGFELPAPVLADTLRGEPLPPEWIISLIDGADTIISRAVDASRFVGRTAGPDLRRNALHDEGSWRGSNLDGVAVISGYARTQLANWRVVVGAPLSAVEQRLRRALLLLTGGGLLLTLGSLALAIRLARQISEPLRELAGAGALLARGDVLEPVNTRVREVAAVSSALRAASMALRTRTEALDAERTRLAAIIDTVPVGLLIVNPDMTVASGNAQMAEILGGQAAPSPFAGPSPLSLDLRMADGSAVPDAALPPGRALRGEANPELECRLHRQDGSTLWVYLIAAPIHDRARHVSAAVVAALDVEEVVRARDEKARSAILLERQVAERTVQLEDANTRLRREIVSRTAAEAQLRQVQKMEAVGQLSGGIAHDFNNLLTIVIGCLDMLRVRMADDRTRRLADNALDGAQRAAVLTARLLAFSRQQPLMPRALDLNHLVAGMADLFQRTLGEQVQLETELDPALWLVHADPNQLENVLLNLAVNAKDAIAASSGTTAGEWGSDTRGRLAITTSNIVLDAAAFVDVDAGDYVRIAVSDTGAGMPPDVIARAFEPFFTTKPIGQGTGLGLSQVHGFVKQSGGHVDISSRILPNPVHGTTVTLYLPREPQEAEPAAPGPAAPALQLPSPAPLPIPVPSLVSGSPTGVTILVVEDEPGVRSLACDALEELGYTVVAAGNVAAALDALSRSPEIALLFTDMVLPESSGRTLAEEARRRRPDLPILYTTGYSTDRALREGRLRSGEALIDKPYTVRQLADTVSDLLR